MMEHLSKEEVFSKGIEFAGEVCFSGEYGQQVYTKDESEDGLVKLVKKHRTKMI